MTNPNPTVASTQPQTPTVYVSGGNAQLLALLKKATQSPTQIRKV
jgi:hypothetical protein